MMASDPALIFTVRQEFVWNIKATRLAAIKMITARAWLSVEMSIHGDSLGR
jgi:hypothetical protein